MYLEITVDAWAQSNSGNTMKIHGIQRTKLLIHSLLATEMTRA